MEPARLAVDVESGDYGPRIIIAGILDAQRAAGKRFITYLCGERKSIETVLAELAPPDDIRKGLIIEHCPDKIDPGDNRSRVWKTRENSSIIRSIALQKEGVVQASISAGDTGILMGAAIFILGRLDGVPRPALAAHLPTMKGKPVLLLDVGANLDCRSDHLVSFALMGSRYVHEFSGDECPRVALLNIGSEPIKGTRVVCEAGKALEKRCTGYVGFIEGDQVLSGNADVVVCDGFVGNVLLKLCESFHSLAGSILGNHEDLLLKIENRMTVLNPENYGAVPLLGIRGRVLKAHGGSSPKAIANAVRTAITSVERAVV